MPVSLRVLQVTIAMLLLALLSACSTAPPKNMDNACAIFKEKKSWYKQAKKAENKWGTPVATMLAFVHQESRFVHNARPPRKYFLGFIPRPRKSSAYGYPQAQNATWRGYQRATGNYRHKRTNFADSMMFIGWYNDQTLRRNKVAKTDAYRQYLAYHEGHGGFSRGSFNQKAWLMEVATKVASRSATYQSQLLGCEKQLQKRRRFLGIF